MSHLNTGVHHHGGTQPQHGEEPGSPVLTGASGMMMINEMFQRQARRLESQQHAQAQDMMAVEHSQAQLLVMQAQLQFHAAHYQERAEQVHASSETITRMQNYISAMEGERARAVEEASFLARDVNYLCQHVQTSQPGKLETLSTTLSDMAKRVRETGRRGPQAARACVLRGVQSTHRAATRPLLPRCTRHVLCAAVAAAPHALPLAYTHAPHPPPRLCVLGVSPDGLAVGSSRRVRRGRT
jgi:hypothetical protein